MINDSRPSVDEILLKTAKLWSERSYCRRLQVGAVISKNGRIISTGYNGAPSGMENCCEEEKYDGFGVQLVTLPEIVHAEANCILVAAKEGRALQDCDIYITHAPCSECAKMIIQSGIKTVHYSQEYRDNTGVKLLIKAGLNVKCWDSV